MLRVMKMVQKEQDLRAQTAEIKAEQKVRAKVNTAARNTGVSPITLANPTALATPTNVLPVTATRTALACRRNTPRLASITSASATSPGPSNHLSGIVASVNTATGTRITHSAATTTTAATNTGLAQGGLPTRSEPQRAPA